MKVIIILLVFTGSTALACHCYISPVADNYAQSNFVAYVNVLKVIPNEPDSKHYYKIQIEPVAVFKGKPTNELWVYGSLDGSNWTSCDLIMPANSKWIIYAKPDGNDKTAVHLCNGSWQTDAKFDKTQYPDLESKYAVRLERELNILKVLKKKASGITYSYMLHNPTLKDFLAHYNDIPFPKNFAEYQISFDANTKAKSVKVLKSLDKQFDRALVAFIKQSKWLALYNKKVPDNGVYLMGIYQYEENGERFLSIYNH
ncbi:MAG TPA: hypothetical protein VGD22_18350 [Sphingobacteriaceae bacterium]